MKYLTTAARILLGLMFTVFGLNGFLHFIPLPPPASPLALQYMTVLATSSYFAVVFLLQLVGGLLLLANRFTALALAILAPILVNVLLYHGLMEPSGIGLGLFATLLWTVVFWRERAAFAGLFRPSTPVAA
jgi:putative oxidoreductase